MQTNWVVTFEDCRDFSGHVALIPASSPADALAMLLAEYGPVGLYLISITKPARPMPWRPLAFALPATPYREGVAL